MLKTLSDSAASSLASVNNYGKVNTVKFMQGQGRGDMALAMYSIDYSSKFSGRLMLGAQIEKNNAYLSNFSSLMLLLSPIIRQTKRLSVILKSKKQ